MSETKTRDDRIADALEALTKKSEAGPVPQISITRFKPQTPWNPSGDKRTKLKRPTSINGHRLRELLLSPEEIKLLNELKPGKYGPRKSWVVIEENGGDVAESSAIHFYFPNRTVEQRLEFNQHARNLLDALTMIVEEQKRPVAS